MKSAIVRYIATPTSVNKIALIIVKATSKKVDFLPTKIIKRPD